MTVKYVTFRWNDATSAEWAERNTVLQESEPGRETDTGWFKVGDGSTPWNDLPYFIDAAEILRLLTTDLPPGPQGFQGFQGVTGSQGPQGRVGAQGSVGAQGGVGAQGAVGGQGAQGGVGSQGSQGSSGPQGQSGTQGAQGVKGDIGPAGFTWRGVWQSGINYVEDDSVSHGGSSWFATEDPPTGEVPSQASAYWEPMALVGSQGAQGPQGGAGAQGASGGAGPQGSQGPQGTQGSQGSQGLQGPQGSLGNQGTMGNQGNQGAQGTQGTQGSTGTFSTGVRLGYLFKNTSYTLTDTNYMVDFDASTGPLVAGFPTASGRAGQTWVVRKSDASGNSLTIDPNGAELINGQATYVITDRYETATVMSDGTGLVVL